MLKLIGRAIQPLRVGVRAMSTSSSSKTDNNEYFYQTDFSHASVVLGETTASMRIDHHMQSMNQDHYTPQNFVNNRMERMNLKNLSGGKVELYRNFETGVAEIKLSHPEKANALSGSMMVELADIIQDLEGWDEGKAVILYGDPEGVNFCAGADVNSVRSLGTRNGGLMCLFMQNALSRLQRLPMISVASIQGNAIGGGAELTAACDFRVMCPNASIRFVQAKMGVSPGWGGGTRLVRIVGPRTGLKLLTSAQSVSATEAVEMGLSDFTVAKSDEICNQTIDWLKQYTSAPTDIVRAMKTLVKHASELPLDQALQREKHVFTSLWGGPLQQAAFENFSG